MIALADVVVEEGEFKRGIKYRAGWTGDDTGRRAVLYEWRTEPLTPEEARELWDAIADLRDRNKPPRHIDLGAI